ncbi:hypothetical protein SAMN02910358_00578 [Lachnospiraceae bacterium XBB1006]|nr:hypothetical protein SAMN02910358_00578 [Lachnospiraceae bacterium XBB1006]
MTDKNEDYLDQLLNSVIGADDTKASASDRQQEESREDRRRKRKKDAQKFFIDDFEKELENFEESSELTDFDLEMEQLLADEQYKENMRDEQPPQSVQTSEPAMDDSFFAGLSAAMSGESGEQPEPEPDSVIGTGSVPDVPVAVDGNEEALAEENVDDLAALLASMGGEEAPDEQPPAEQPSEEAPTDTGSESETENGDADDILSLLNGLGGEDDDLAGISELLKADENNEPIEAATETADGMEIDPSDVAELSGLKEVSKEDKGVKDSEEKKKKPGFLAKLKNALFGPDEEEQEAGKEEGMKVTTADDLDGLSDENLDILKALEGGDGAGGGESADDPKAKKKADKEAKKKAKEEKAKEKKAAKEAKKKEKQAKKAAKPKKEKKPKVKDNTPPLPKLPVFLIFVMAFSFAGAVLFAGNGFHSRLVMKNSESYFEQGDYQKAYAEIAGMSFKKKEQADYATKVSILAGMQELLEAYETLESTGRHELALDALIRVVGRYDANLERAEELGYTDEMTEMEKRAAKTLKKQYKMKYDEAVSLYRIRSRSRYSTELYKKLVKLGIV